MNELKANEIGELSNRLANEVLSGNVNPLDAFVTLKKIEETIKNVKSQIEELALDEASKHPKTFNHLGVEITSKSSAGRWDFKHIPEVVELEKELKQLKDRHKLAHKSSDQLVSNDGEIIQPANYNEGKNILSIKLKK